MTKIYGASDDLVEFEGDFSGEVECYEAADREKGVLVVVSDGTILKVRYGKFGDAVWEVLVLRQGNLFLRIDPCSDPDADIYSDIAVFNDGIIWAYAATGWEAVT